MSQSLTQIGTITTSAFINSIGVNTHIFYGGDEYASASADLTDLRYLGTTNARDSYDPTQASIYSTLGQAGIKFDFVMYAGGSVTISDIQTELSQLDQLESAAPGSVAAVEGPNEVNNWPITYNGQTSLGSAITFQTDLYSLAHADSSLPGVKVYYFTGYGMGSYASGPNPATTAGLADYDNAHPYPQNGMPPFEGLANSGGALNPLRQDALLNESPATGPAVYTETGYNMNSGGSGLQGAAVGDVEILLDDAQQGIALTYLYQLQETGAGTAAGSSDGLGLFNGTTPTSAATAIHDLTTILNRAGTPSSTASGITFSVSNLPSSTGHEMEFTGGNGTSFIALWNEASTFNQPPSPTTVTVNFTGNKSVSVFDPIQSATALQSYTNVSNVNLSLAGDPLILQVSPTSSSGSTTPTDALTLRMSEEAYDGDAQFVVRVNGTQVGGTMMASALHSTGDSNVFVLKGNWGQGSQDVQIQFLNDAYGGSSTMDRNLYVASVAYDGVTYANTIASLLWDKSQDFSVGGTNTTAAAPADQLTLHLSEDGWNGNAQFVLTIDGKQISTPQDVTALHSAGAWENLTFAGNFGGGTHQVGVEFTNDAYAGSPTMDRNLYVNGVSCNGTNYGSGVTALMSNGSAVFTITTTH
jgi:hypothetical protein